MEEDYKQLCWGILIWMALIFGLMLLAGCAKKTDPVIDMNNQLQQDVAQLVDYANNNMDNDPDTKLLVVGLKDCAARADAATQQHKVSIEACEARTGKVKAERNTLALVLVLLVAIKLFNIRL